jgi:hypothetical protein
MNHQPAQEPASPTRPHRSRCARLVVSLCFVLVLGGCAGPVTQRVAVGPIIDGFPLGEPVGCGTAFYRCDDLIALARSALDERDPGHANIVGASPYHEDLQSPALFDPSIPHARSGQVFVVVFDLADSSRHASGVDCGVGGCHPLATYPH